MICCVGCYTDETHPEGIRIVAVNPEAGTLVNLSSVCLPDAIYLALSVCGDYLLACESGGLAAFRIDGARLVLSDQMTWGGECLCHVAALADGKHVSWADYLAGEAGHIGFAAGHFVNGSLVRHRHVGSGPNLPRQAAAHCHQAIPLPNRDSYAVVDLGLDCIAVYPEGRRYATFPKGAGARHLAFHPNGKFAFLASELGNLVSVYRLNATGDFEYLSSASTLPVGWKGTSTVAAIRVSSDGARVFVTNRGHDSIAAFAFDGARSSLSLLAISPMPGSCPRDLTFLPDERYALATLERSGILALLSCDRMTGRFETVGQLDDFHRPSSVIALPRS